VQAKVDAAMQLLGSKPKPTIAFHARGGDKRDEDIKCARAGSPPWNKLETRMDVLSQQSHI